MQKILSGKSTFDLLPKKTAARYAGQFETMRSVEKLDRNIYLMECKYDYALDELLKKGLSNTAELIEFAGKRMFCGAKNTPLKDGEFGCSAFDTYNEKGEHLMGRNFDYKSAPVMLVHTAPANGYKSLSFADCNFMIFGYDKPEDKNGRLRALLAPYCCVDGMNEKGLAIAVLEIKAKATAQDTGKTPITTTVMIRTVLDKAATVEEAIELFRQFDMHAAFGVDYHFMISDASGNSVLLEYIDNEIVLFYPEKHTENGLPFIGVTNHYLDPRGDKTRGSGYERLRYINETLTENGGSLSEMQSLELLERVHLEYYHKLGWKVITLWSAVYNCNDLSITVTAGEDYESIYKFTVGEKKFERI